MSTSAGLDRKKKGQIGGRTVQEGEREIGWRRQGREPVRIQGDVRSISLFIM